jgi:hypothetical protein
MLLNARGRHGIRQIESSIRSYTKEIEKHRSWVNNPALKLSKNVSDAAVQRYVTQKWPRDIARLIEQRDVMIGLLAEMKK